MKRLKVSNESTAVDNDIVLDLSSAPLFRKPCLITSSRITSSQPI